jgi:F-type H+-transporting ATPase subunit b
LELNWSTFLLEIFNFLVLVWILKRFLYQPVLDVITRRRVKIEDQLAEARQLHTDSDALKQQYEHRLSDWEQERQTAMEKLQDELEETRQKQLANLKSEIAREEEKTQVIRSRQNKQAILEIEKQALQQGAQFASRLLAEASGPELESRLFDLLLTDLAALSADQVSELSNKWGEPPEHILVTSAYPLPDDRRHRLEDILSKVTGLASPVHYEQDTALIAGLHITINAWALQLNVRDELQGFIELSHVND